MTIFKHNTIPLTFHEKYLNISKNPFFQCLQIHHFVPHLDQGYLCSAQHEPRFVTLIKVFGVRPTRFWY